MLCTAKLCHTAATAREQLHILAAPLMATRTPGTCRHHRPAQVVLEMSYRLVLFARIKDEVRQMQLCCMAPLKKGSLEPSLRLAQSNIRARR